MSQRPRILSGMRPTGRLHVGHLEGALRNWVGLQDTYECFYMVADWHALTTGYEDTGDIQEYTRDMVVDWLAAGIDPERSVVFVQSHVPEHAILHLLLSMITPVPWLERCPTYKEWIEELNLAGSPGYGLLGYPVLQAADILVYKANAVPVGKDQLPHLELAREIARRFNHLYGNALVEPEAKLTEFPALPGIDNRKMSKSYGNDICMADSDDVLRSKVQRMFTDPRKIYLGDPGHPEECPVYLYYQVYGKEAEAAVATGCRAGSRPCVGCKKELAERMLTSLGALRLRRRELEQDMTQVDAVLREGDEKARAVASQTLKEVNRAMKLA